MTAETDLLPLPPLWICPNVEPADFPEVAKALIDYARANVARATAPLQAEIETLRAEVSELHMHAKRRDQYAVEKAAQALDWKKRAERLAETLRDAADDIDAGVPPEDAAAHLRARADLLRKQEEGHEQ